MHGPPRRWDLVGGAFETVRRPLGMEATIFGFGVAILALIPLVRSTLRWPLWAAFVVCSLHLIFAVAGVALAPPDEGFGRPGPAIAAVFLAGAAAFSFAATRKVAAPAGR